MRFNSVVFQMMLLYWIIADCYYRKGNKATACLIKIMTI